MGVSDAIDISQHNKKIIHELLEQHLPNTKVWVYGSRVKRTARPNSDLDMVAFIKKEQSASFDDLKEAFEESDLPFRVDLFRWDEIPDQFHQNIKSDYVVLQDEVGSSDGWVDDSLGNVLEIKYGKDHKKLPDGNIPCYGTGGIMRKVDSSLYDQESILIPRKGSLNNIYFVDKPFWTVDTLFWTKIDKSLIDPKFMFYQLKLTDFTSLNVGSAVPSLTVPVLNDLKIKYPSLPEQNSIAHILGSLDDKIELNRQMNETLESMAQALFKSWFVDFDPVIDNALAAGNPIPDVFAERAEKRASKGSLRRGSGRTSDEGISVHPELVEGFPSEFKFTDKMGWIPKGWDVGSFSDIANENPESWTKKNSPETVLYVDLANTKNGRINHAEFYEYSDAPSRARRVLDIDDTIIGLVRPGNRSFAYIQKEGLTGSTGFAVMRPIKQEYRSFLYLGLTQDDVIDYFAHIADGAAYPAIRPEVVANLECVIPSFEILELFDSLVNPNLNKIGENEKQGNELAKLRDTLLPKLLSGELRIPDAKKIIKEAGV